MGNSLTGDLDVCNLLIIHFYLLSDIHTHSLIEANLVIITGCLPTMRLFFRHVAPRLIGESSIRSRSRKQSNGYAGGSQHHQSELKTIGPKHTKNVYDRMEDDNVSVGSEERATAGWQGDQDSVRSIVSSTGLGRITKTQSIVIESEVADGRKLSEHLVRIG
jgi:hypothetical protein